MNLKATSTTTLLLILMACGSSYRLEFMRLPNSNIITLTCQESTTLSNIPGAFYFLNGSDLQRINPNGLIASNDKPGSVTFQITREYEGWYSCGNESTRPLSNNISLIGECIILL